MPESPPESPATPTISLMSANYVARELDYHMTGGWMEGDFATNETFSPADTFPERFAALLDEIKALEVSAVDLWVAHLNPRWVTADHIIAAREELRRRNLQVASLAGSFGDTPELFEQSCKLAAELGAPVLGGSSALLEHDREMVLALLGAHGVVFGLENHPEKTPDELLAKLGGDDPRIGVALDTGWFGTHGYDAAQATREVFSRLVHVHLKDVKAAGAHDTCAYGEGVVPVEDVVRELTRLGYEGGVSVEHEPERENPANACRASIEKLRGWLS